MLRNILSQIIINVDVHYNFYHSDKCERMYVIKNKKRCSVLITNIWQVVHFVRTKVNKDYLRFADLIDFGKYSTFICLKIV